MDGTQTHAGADARVRRVMAGEARGPGAVALRAMLAAAEPAYAAVAAGRNWLFDHGFCKVHRLPRPVVSVGNLTTGGTGKTPVVRWLAEQLRHNGRHVAVLARGYKARRGEPGDEQLMLDRMLNGDASPERVHVVANPDRYAAAVALLGERPEVDVFVLDDGFQHRRLARDLDVVVVSAVSPFGYDHVLPRGMLREPLAGLRRAGAVVLTHADQVAEAAILEIERRVRKHNPDVPVYRSVHAPAGLRDAGDCLLPAGAIAAKRWFAFCGVGDPGTFVRQLRRMGGHCVGWRAFADHHRYGQHDIEAVRAEAAAGAAEVLVTTEKDWAKLARLDGLCAPRLPVWRVDVSLHLLGDGEARLLEQVSAALNRH